MLVVGMEGAPGVLSGEDDGGAARHARSCPGDGASGLGMP